MEDCMKGKIKKSIYSSLTDTSRNHINFLIFYKIILVLELGLDIFKDRKPCTLEPFTLNLSMIVEKMAVFLLT